MNLFKVSDFYLNRIVSSKPADSTVLPGSRIKVLLLDSTTTAIISLNCTQSELLLHEIYLISRIDNHDRDKLRHLKCICFLKPTEESINHLLSELRNPKYSSYELYFNNTVSKVQLERLAESDDLEVVTKIEEVFQDYLIINDDLFSLNIKNVYGEVLNSWNSVSLNSTISSLKSVLLSLKIKPVIRFDSNSKMAQVLSKELIYEIQKDSSSLFEFRLKETPPTLLILDRKNDPITPLLLPWTFQSMVHELIGIENNTVDLSNVPDVQPDLKKIVLSAKNDEFFKDSMFLNFGDLSDKIKDYVNIYKSKTKSNKNLESINDMKRFIEEFPEFKKLSLNVTKHMTLISELNSKINSERLWEISELEQNLSNDDNNHNDDYQELEALLLNKPPQQQQQQQQQKPISVDYKIKLVLIYSLKYFNNPNNQINRLKELLKTQGVPLEKINLIDTFLKYSNYTFNNENNDQSIFEKIKSKKFSTDNIYMQHVTRLEKLLNKIVNNKLNNEKFPAVSPYDNNMNVNYENEKCQELIIFIIGGVTFEEARIVSKFNELNKNLRIILGGTTIHNTTSFVKSLS